jgi:DNA topoisomerase-2
VEFVVKFKNEKSVDEFVKNNDVVKYFKLSKTISTNNMYLFVENNIPKKFNSIKEIFDEWFNKRLEMYTLRKNYILENVSNDLKYFKNQMRFIDEFIKKTLVIINRKKYDIIKELVDKKYDKKDSSYDYLLNMSIISLTEERMKNLNDKIEKSQKYIMELKDKSVENLWLEDIEG